MTKPVTLLTQQEPAYNFSFNQRRQDPSFVWGVNEPDESYHCVQRTNDEVDYEITRKGEPERGSVISQKSLATFITKIIETPEKYTRESLGITNQILNNERNTEYRKTGV